MTHVRSERRACVRSRLFRAEMRYSPLGHSFGDFPGAEDIELLKLRTSVGNLVQIPVADSSESDRPSQCIAQ